MSEVRYLVAGDSAVCVEFGNEISPEINKKIRAFKIACLLYTSDAADE